MRQLFKDEVRACGAALGLPYDMVYRQPFPGPGLGVRCLGAITRPRLEALRESDAILREEFAAAGLDEKVWQYFTIVPDMKSVGVRGNARCEEWPAIIRAVNTVDAMTADNRGNTLRRAAPRDKAHHHRSARHQPRAATTSPQSPRELLSGNDFRGPEKPDMTGFLRG